MGAGRAQVDSLILFGLGLALTSGSLGLLAAITEEPARVLELTVLVLANVAAGLVRFWALQEWIFAPRRHWAGSGLLQQRKVPWSRLGT